MVCRIAAYRYMSCLPLRPFLSLSLSFDDHGTIIPVIVLLLRPSLQQSGPCAHPPCSHRAYTELLLTNAETVLVSPGTLAAEPSSGVRDSLIFSFTFSAETLFHPLSFAFETLKLIE